jgi:hypothetical protein
MSLKSDTLRSMTGHSQADNAKQDRQCAHNVTLRRVRGTVVVAEEQ